MVSFLPTQKEQNLHQTPQFLSYYYCSPVQIVLQAALLFHHTKGICEDSVAALLRVHSFGIETEMCQAYLELICSNHVGLKYYIFRLFVKTIC